MQFDFDAYLGTVSRTVTELDYQGKPARRVTLERTYNTTTGDLWDAITNPERLPRWFLPISGELRPGGRYQLEGNAGGTITACTPPRHLFVTWEFGGGMSWVDVRIAAAGESQARLTLSHICPVDDHWRKYGPGAVGVGWDLGLLGLAIHVAPAGHAGFNEEAFMDSSEGKSYVADCSEGWRRAAVAAGEDPARARSASRHTTEFYTGETPQGS